MPKRPEFSSEEQEHIVRTIREDTWKDLQDRRVWLSRRAEALAEVLFPEPLPKTYPWPGASNVTPPLALKITRAIWPRMVNALVGEDTVVQAAPVDATSQESLEDADARQAYMNYEIRNVIPRFRREVSSFLFDVIHGGSSVLHVFHERRVEIRPQRFVIDNFNLAPDGTPFSKTDREAFREIFGPDLLKARPLGSSEYELTLLSQGRKQTARTKIEREEEDLREDEMAIFVEREIVFSRNRVKSDDVENWIVPSSASGYQKENAHHLSRRFHLHPDQIREDSSFFNLTDEDLENLEKMTGDLELLEDSEKERIKTEILGVDKEWGLSGMQESMVLFLEHYRPWPLTLDRGDFVETRMVDMIFWTVPALRKLARWEYHNTVFEHGLRPVVDMAFIPVSGRPDGVGVYHLVKQFQDEAKVILDQMNDRENLVNNPSILYEGNSGLDVRAFKSRGPGDAFRVRSVDRVKPLTWDVNPHGGFPIYQTMVAAAEQAGGAGDISAGVQPSRPNAPRTARGTLAIIGESNIVQEFHLLLAQETLAEVLHQLDGLIEQHVPPEVRFSITGKEERVLRREAFRTRVRYFLSGNTVNTNPQVRMQIAQFLNEILAGHPFMTGQFIQMPEMAIRNSYRLVDHVIRQHVPGRDASFLLPPVEEFVEFAGQIQEAQARAQQERVALQEEQATSEMEAKEAEMAIKGFKAAGDRKSKEESNLVSLFGQVSDVRAAQANQPREEGE